MKLPSAFLIVSILALTAWNAPAARASQDEYRLGVLHYVEREYDDALKAFRSYLKDHPQSESAQQWITIIESSQPNAGGSPQFQVENLSGRQPSAVRPAPPQPSPAPASRIRPAAPQADAPQAQPVKDDSEARRLAAENERLEAEIEAQKRSWEAERVGSALRLSELSEGIEDAQRKLRVSEARRNNLEKRISELQAEAERPREEDEALKAQVEALERKLLETKRAASERDGEGKRLEDQLSSLRDKVRALSGELESSRSRAVLAEDKARLLTLKIKEQAKKAPAQAAVPAAAPDMALAEELGKTRQENARLRVDLEKLRDGMSRSAENVKTARSAGELEKQLAAALAEKQSLENSVRDLHVILDRVNHELRQHQLAIRDFRQKQDEIKPDCPE